MCVRACVRACLRVCVCVRGEVGVAGTKLTLHCHHQNDFCITEIGSDESHSSISRTVKGKVSTVSIRHGF